MQIFNQSLFTLLPECVTLQQQHNM